MQRPHMLHQCKSINKLGKKKNRSEECKYFTDKKHNHFTPLSGEINSVLLFNDEIITS